MKIFIKLWVMQILFFSLINCCKKKPRSIDDVGSDLLKCKSDESCVPLRDCQPMQNLLRSRDFVGRQMIQQQICKRENSQISVCCPEESVLPLDTLFPKNCGYSIGGGRISGGRNTSLGEFPWLVAIIYSATNAPSKKKVIRCAGSLINPRYVLTAAHCVHEGRLRSRKIKLEELRIGDHDLTSDEDCLEVSSSEQMCFPPFITAEAEEIINHPDFEQLSLKNDIALIRLSLTVKMDPVRGYVAPVCLPDQDVSAEFISKKMDLTPTAVGWGYTRDVATPSNIPLKVDLPFFNKTSCGEIFGRVIISKQLCAGGGQSVEDTCMGDSGGPLLLAGNPSIRHLQIGVISYGPAQCGLIGIPGVYTSVSHYKNWMQSVMKPW